MDDRNVVTVKDPVFDDWAIYKAVRQFVFSLYPENSSNRYEKGQLVARREFAIYKCIDAYWFFGFSAQFQHEPVLQVQISVSANPKEVIVQYRQGYLEEAIQLAQRINQHLVGLKATIWSEAKNLDFNVAVQGLIG